MRKRLLIAVGALLVMGFGALCYLMGGPRGAYGFLRYALPQWRSGELAVGDPAPDVELVALNGSSRFRLHEKIGSRPLVLVFGSYT